MDATKRGALFMALALALGLLLAFGTPGEASRVEEDTQLVVGVGDDITGRLMEQILARYQQDGREGAVGSDRSGDLSGEWRNLLTTGQTDMDSYLFIDCCSNAGQWSLLTQDTDLGFYCTHISMAIVNQNEGFSIYGPVVMNGEVLGHWTEPSAIRTMAIPMKREHLAQLVRTEYPEVDELREVSATSILYAFEDHQVDGAVMDIARAFQLPQYDYTYVTQQDYVSYCLVVRDDIIDTPQFQTFLRYYNQTAEAMNDRDTMQALYGMDDGFWQTVRLKFLYLPQG